MADHFISLNRGEQCFVYSDFVHGTSSRSSSDIELRVRDGAGWSRKEVVTALDAFARFVETQPWVVSAGVEIES